MLYEEETALIRRGLFDVQNGVGLGRHEEIYHKALVMWFKKEGIPFVSKQSLPLLLNGETAHVLYPDFVVWNKIPIELKAVPHRLQSSEHVQLFNYLKLRNDKLGLLVNMGLDRVHAERIIYEPNSCELVEDWNCWNDLITGTDREVGLKIREVLRNIKNTHQTGYGKEIIEKLVSLGLKQEGLQVASSPVGASIFHGCVLGNTPLDCLLIENRLLLVLTALFEDNQFNVGRGLSFMNTLHIPWGIAVNFGKRNVQIQGLSNNNIRGAALPSVGPPEQIIRGSALPSVGPSEQIIRGSALPSVGSSEQIIRGAALPSVGPSEQKGIMK